MVAFYNNMGGKMLVHESRVEEYKAAGYKLVALTTVEEEKAEEPKPVKRKRGK